MCMYIDKCTYMICVCTLINVHTHIMYVHLSMYIHDMYTYIYIYIYVWARLRTLLRFWVQNYARHVPHVNSQEPSISKCFAPSIEHVPHVNALYPPLWMMLYARVEPVFSSLLCFSCEASTRECAGPAPLDDVAYNGPNRCLFGFCNFFWNASTRKS